MHFHYLFFLPEIQSLILQGKISQSLHLIRANYPTLFTSNPELLFRVKCRQFVEMIVGSDPGDLSATGGGEPRLSCHSELSSTSSDGEGVMGEVTGSPPESPLGSPMRDGTFTIPAVRQDKTAKTHVAWQCNVCVWVCVGVCVCVRR